MQEDKFSVFIPLELEKAGDGDDRYGNMKFKGIASNPNFGDDKQGEWLDPSGFQLEQFLREGTINYHHLWPDKPLTIIGEPTLAKVTKGNEFYIEGKLYKDSPVARDVYDLAEILEKNSETRRLGFSIEGKALARDPKNKGRITKAKITNCAITPAPICPGTKMELIKGGFDDLKFQEDGKELIIDVTDANGIRYTVDNDLNITKGSKGEGTRGGKVVGHTKAGNAIYASKKQDHSDMSTNDSGNVVMNGKVIGGYEFDEDSNSFWATIPGTETQQSFETKDEMYTAFKNSLKKAEGVQEASTAAEMDGVTTKESLEAGRKKNKKKSEGKKIFSKAETYNEIFSMFNSSVKDARHFYQLVEQVQYVLTPNMEKTQITQDAILKAQELLGLVVKTEGAAAPAQPSAEDLKKAEDIKKAEDAKKEKQTQLDDLLKKAEALRAELNPAASTQVEIPKVETQAAVAPKESNDNFMKAFDEKFKALGTLVSAKDQEIDSIKTENAELKKGIADITAFNEALAKKIGLIAQQPLDRKSITTEAFKDRFAKAEGAEEKGVTVIDIADLKQRSDLASLMFKAATKNPEKLDDQFAKAIPAVELGSLGTTEREAASLSKRLFDDFKIKVVRSK